LTFGWYSSATADKFLSACFPKRLLQSRRQHQQLTVGKLSDDRVNWKIRSEQHQSIDQPVSTDACAVRETTVLTLDSCFRSTIRRRIEREWQTLKAGLGKEISLKQFYALIPTPFELALRLYAFCDDLDAEVLAGS